MVSQSGGGAGARLLRCHLGKMMATDVKVIFNVYSGEHNVIVIHVCVKKGNLMGNVL